MGRPVRVVTSVIGSGPMSQPVIMLLTKRRPIDFGLVATCLCRLG
jgi:hypothetical protein